MGNRAITKIPYKEKNSLVVIECFMSRSIRPWTIDTTFGGLFSGIQSVLRWISYLDIGKVCSVLKYPNSSLCWSVGIGFSDLLQIIRFPYSSDVDLLSRRMNHNALRSMCHMEAKIVAFPQEVVFWSIYQTLEF